MHISIHALVHDTLVLHDSSSATKAIGLIGNRAIGPKCGSRASRGPARDKEERMIILIRIKFRAFRFTWRTERLAYGISHDEKGNWTIAKLGTPTDEEFDRMRKIFNKWGITIATSGTLI